MSKTKGNIVAGYAKMWPRAVFDLREKGKKKRELLKEPKERLSGPGVYVLYRDDLPYYIGKTERGLHERLYNHANQFGDQYYNFWNYFSAFEISRKSHRDEVEAILIAAMPTANSAKPKIQPIPLPRKVLLALAKRREVPVGSGS